MPEAETAAPIETTSEAVAACASRDHVRAAESPALVATILGPPSGLGTASAPAGLGPAVPIRRPAADDPITRLEDGRTVPSTGRHLGVPGSAPDRYRAKRCVPADRPTVAPAHAKARSDLAKGLHFVRESADDSPPDPDETRDPPALPEMRKLEHPTRQSHAPTPRL